MFFTPALVAMCLIPANIPWLDSTFVLTPDNVITRPATKEQWQIITDSDTDCVTAILPMILTKIPMEYT